MTWCGLKIKENYHVLVNKFHGSFRSKPLSFRKNEYVFRDVKWCFNASWGPKGFWLVYWQWYLTWNMTTGPSAIRYPFIRDLIRPSLSFWRTSRTLGKLDKYSSRGSFNHACVLASSTSITSCRGNTMYALNLWVVIYLAQSKWIYLLFLLKYFRLILFNSE